MRPIVLMIGCLVWMKNRECYETNFSGCCSLFLCVVKMVGCKYINIYTVGEWAENLFLERKRGPLFSIWLPFSGCGLANV